MIGERMKITWKDFLSNVLIAADHHWRSKGIRLGSFISLIIWESRCLRNICF